MDTHSNGYSLGTYECSNVEPFQQLNRREKLSGQNQNLQQGEGQKSKTLYYCGKVRKCAVRSCPAIMRPSKNEHEVDASGGKTRSKSMPSEVGAEMGNNFLSSKGGVGNARQVFDERPQRVMNENKSLISAELPKKHGVRGSMRTNTNTSVGFKPKMGAEKSVINIGEERKKLLNWFRAECALLRKRGELSNRIDHMAYNVLKESGDLFMNEKKLGPILGVEIGDRFEFRLELVIMGIHGHHLRGIDFMETSNGRVVATSIVATEGYGDCMKADELIYTGEGGGNFEASNRWAKDQELKGGNLALKNSIKEGNYVRVVRGVKSSGKNMKATRTTFVYDGLYKVVDYSKKTGVNGKMQFEFTLKRCSGQKIIDWAKYR